PAAPFLDALLRTGALGPAGAPVDPQTAPKAVAQDAVEEDRLPLAAATAGLGALPGVLFPVAIPPRDLPAGELPTPAGTPGGAPARHPAEPGSIRPTRTPTRPDHAPLEAGLPVVDGPALEASPRAAAANAPSFDGPVPDAPVLEPTRRDAPARLPG